MTGTSGPAAPGDNSRKGKHTRTVLTELGPVPVDVPRDRDATIEPQIVRKRQRRLVGSTRSCYR